MSHTLLLEEFEKLANFGVETIRISDEMFFLNKNYYEPLLNGIIDRGLKFNLWAYSRVDTVKERYLDLFKNAGINWLALGIESGNQNVRLEISKGKFKEVHIKEVVQTIQSHDINVLGNYIFGFPNEDFKEMQETLDLAIDLNTEHANFYPCQALPGSPLYTQAKIEGWKLPDSYEGYAFLSYESEPLPTRFRSASEVLEFRDNAWQKYFTNQNFLSLVEKKFGTQQKENLIEMTKISLKKKAFRSLVIISKTPYRISFFGGGTDYPEWYNRNGGSVISTAINYYSYITVKDLKNFYKHKYRILYAKTEETNTIKNINHPSVKEVFKIFKN